MAQTKTQVVVEKSVSVDNAASLLHRVVRNVVTDPDAVEVETEMAGDTALFLVRVAADDLASIMGSSQRIFTSLQCVVAALGRRSGFRFSLNIPTVNGLSS